jgi:LDH2 family malate/lactate/ureidoglycolate dehydrogenase
VVAIGSLAKSRLRRRRLPGGWIIKPGGRPDNDSKYAKSGACRWIHDSNVNLPRSFPS